MDAYVSEVGHIFGPDVSSILLTMSAHCLHQFLYNLNSCYGGFQGCEQPGDLWARTASTKSSSCRALPASHFPAVPAGQLNEFHPACYPHWWSPSIPKVARTRTSKAVHQIVVLAGALSCETPSRERIDCSTLSENAVMKKR